MLDVARDPVDLLVQLDHAVLELGDFHVPGGDCPVDQWGAAAPAVWVGVLVGGLLNQLGFVLEHIGDGLVRVKDLHTCDVVECSASEHRQELGTFIYREDHRDAMLFTDLLVIFTVGRGLVHDTGTVGGGDVVGRDNLPGVLGAVFLGVGVGVP